MCGIVGIINAKRNESAVLDAMLVALAHRGPDAVGKYVNENGSVFLGSTRLSIQDLSENGKMPMKNRTEDVVVTQNGEIYNYPELRKELEGLGYNFFSDSDTEAIIHGYEEWGIHVVEKLRGMFAIAIYDKKRQRIYKFCSNRNIGFLSISKVSL